MYVLKLEKNPSLKLITSKISSHAVHMQVKPLCVSQMFSIRKGIKERIFLLWKAGFPTGPFYHVLPEAKQTLETFTFHVDHILLHKNTHDCIVVKNKMCWEQPRELTIFNIYNFHFFSSECYCMQNFRCHFSLPDAAAVDWFEPNRFPSSTHSPRRAGEAVKWKITMMPLDSPSA